MYAVGMCVDRRYLLPSLVTLTSIADSLPRGDRRDAAVRVLTPDLSRQGAQVLASLVRRCGFGSFDLRWQTVPAESVMADRSYISGTTYLRFGFTPAFLGRPFLIYVDADVLVRGDIAAPLDGLPLDRIGAVQDEFNPVVGRGPALPGLTERWPHLLGSPYFNAGVLWASAEMLARIRLGVRVALGAGRQHILHNDQCALNLWLLSSGAVHSVTPVFNRFEVGRYLERGDWVRRALCRPVDRHDALALHFVGRHKPWLSFCPHTPEVRAYRTQMRSTLRQVGRAGEQAFGGAR